VLAVEVLVLLLLGLLLALLLLLLLLLLHPYPAQAQRHRMLVLSRIIMTVQLRNTLQGSMQQCSHLQTFVSVKLPSNWPKMHTVSILVPSVVTICKATT
jgi:hypothetical protein